MKFSAFVALVSLTSAIQLRSDIQMEFPDMPNDKKLKAATINKAEPSITEIGRHKRPGHKSLLQFPDMPNDKKLKAATINKAEPSITDIGRHKKPSHKSLA